MPVKKQNKPIVSVTDVGKSFGELLVLQHINFSLQKGEKVGLVGSNGSGKTSLLKILSGEIAPDMGRITYTPHISVGYIPQEFSEQHRHSDPNPDILSALSKVGLSETILQQNTLRMSEGEKVKIRLAHILASKHDLLLLDEPTNNLDHTGLTILEKFVRSSRSAAVIVSHDREFLDRTVTSIVELDEHTRTSKVYGGNYTAYREMKEVHIQKQWQKYADHLERIEKGGKSIDQKFEWVKKIERKRKGINKLPIHEKEKPEAAILRDQEAKMAKKAKVFRERVEKHIEEKRVEKPVELLPLNLEFETSAKAGNIAFELKGVEYKLPNFKLGPIDLTINQQDRILITGDNGSGKTTLLKLILGELAPDSGKIARGKSIQIGYLPQVRTLDQNKTVRDIVQEQFPNDEGMVRRTLHRYRLEAKDIEKNVGDLSSGERSRLQIALIASLKPNCLILDEPSNHLDLEILEELERALKSFNGTLIVISHDRYFISRISFTKTLILRSGELTETKGFTC